MKEGRVGDGVVHKERGGVLVRREDTGSRISFYLFAESDSSIVLATDWAGPLALHYEGCTLDHLSRHCEQKRCGQELVVTYVIC